MTNLVTGMIGLVAVCTFLGIMLWWIKALPLTLIVLCVLALLLYDFVQSVRSDNGNGANR